MGLMDMFSIRDIRSFGKGFLGARVEAMQESARVAAEQKKFQDELKANETSDIYRDNEKNKNKAKIDAEKLEKIINGNKSLIISQLQVSPEYVDKMVPSYVLENDQSTWAWLDSQIKKWGVNNWSTRKMNHGFNDGPDGGEGMTIPDYQLSQHVSNFNKPDAVSNLKKGANIPEASADLMTDNKKAKKQINYNGSEVFFGKASAGYSEPVKMINEHTGQTQDVFRREKTPGQKDYTPHLWTLLTDKDNKISYAQLKDRNTWYDVTTPKGISLMHDFHPDLKQTNTKSWMVFKDGQYWSVFGHEDVFESGITETYITGGDARFLNNIEGLSAYEYPAIPEKGFAIPGGLTKEPNYWKIRKKDFDLALQEDNLHLEDHVASTLFESKKLEPLSTYSITDQQNLIEGAMIAAGYQPDVDFTSYRPNALNQTIEFSMTNTSEEPAANSFGSVVLDGVVKLEDLQKQIIARGKNADISDLKISPEIVEALKLPNDNPYHINGHNYARKMGTFYNILRKDIGTNFLNKLDSYTEKETEDRNAFLDKAGIDKEFWGEPNDQLAQRLSQNLLKNKRTFEELITLRNDVDSAMAEKIEEFDLNEQAILHTYLPENVTSVQEFVDQYVTDYSGGHNTDKQMEDLASAIVNLTNGDEYHISIIDAAADKYIEKQSGVKKEKSEFQISTEFEEAKKEEVDTLLENIVLPPDFAVSPGVESITDIFQSEAQIQMRENRLKGWVETHGENWNRLMAIAEAEKPVQFMKTKPKVDTKMGARTIETPAYKEWKAIWWDYVKVDSIAQDLIKKYSQ